MSVTGEQQDVLEEPSLAAGEAVGAAPGETIAGGDEPSGAEESLTTHQVRHRAVTGAVVDTFRAIGVRVFGLAGTIVTARLLTPYDFGLVTIGLTIFTFGSLLDDGGVGTVLIRRPEAPTKAELQALVAFQFALELLLVAVIGLVMLPFGRLGQVTTIIALSLPLNAFRAPAVILYERRLNYRPTAIAEVVQTMVYYVWAIVMIILGWGVFALATAFIVSSLATTLLLLGFLPEARVLPVPSWRKVRPLLGFGVRYQAVALLQMLRDQGVNIVVSGVGGVAVLGLWGIAWRVIQLPVSLLAALWRVSFPGMSRLVAANEDVSSTIERGIALVAIGTGVLVVPLAASGAAWIHVLIGAQWEDASWAVPPACLAMMIGVPLSVSLAGYLWAIGAASAPMRATAAGIPATLVVALALVPFIGVGGAGIAYITGAIAESLLLVYAARKTTTFSIGARLAIPVALAIASGACGWFVERWIGPNLIGGLCSSAVALGAFVGGLAAIHRDYLNDACTLLRRGLRGMAARNLDPRPQPAAG